MLLSKFYIKKSSTYFPFPFKQATRPSLTWWAACSWVAWTTWTRTCGCRPPSGPAPSGWASSGASRTSSSTAPPTTSSPTRTSRMSVRREKETRTALRSKTCSKIIINRTRHTHTHTHTCTSVNKLCYNQNLLTKTENFVSRVTRTTTTTCALVHDPTASPQVKKNAYKGKQAYFKILAPAHLVNRCKESTKAEPNSFFLLQISYISNSTRSIPTFPRFSYACKIRYRRVAICLTSGKASAFKRKQREKVVKGTCTRT